MFGISGAVKYYYCPEPVNMRKSFDGLAGAVESLIHQNPESGHAFLFFGKTLKMVKIAGARLVSSAEKGGWPDRIEQS